jgi:hypothetical protein
VPFTLSTNKLFGFVPPVGLKIIFQVKKLKLKKMNYDCHHGNVMASTTPPATVGGGTEKRAVLIDFGRTLNFNNRNPFPRHMAAIIGTYNSIGSSCFIIERA